MSSRTSPCPATLLAKTASIAGALTLVAMIEQGPAPAVASASAWRAQGGVLEHDIGRFAAKLERDRLDGPGGKLVDALPRAVAAGEGDLRDIRMGDKPLAELGAKSGHDIDDPGGKASFLEQAAKLER
jgi:hypothetical protein